MGAFWTDAEGIFETAREAAHSGSSDCDLAILMGAGGQIRILDAAGWALTGLLAEHGARSGYRITRKNGTLRVEGRSGSDTCLLRSDSPAKTARFLLGSSLALFPERAVSPVGRALVEACTS